MDFGDGTGWVIDHRLFSRRTGLQPRYDETAFTDALSDRKHRNDCPKNQGRKDNNHKIPPEVPSFALETDETGTGMTSPSRFSWTHY